MEGRQQRINRASHSQFGQMQAARGRVTTSVGKEVDHVEGHKRFYNNCDIEGACTCPERRSDDLEIHTQSTEEPHWAGTASVARESKSNLVVADVSRYIENCSHLCRGPLYPAPAKR